MQKHVRDSGEKTPPKNNWHETKIRVRYKDTDRMGVVYYGNYLTYFEIGRAELMRDLGFPYSAFESDGYSLVVIEANAKYHSNVGYDTLVTVRTKISDLRRVRVSFKYEIVDDQCGLLVSGYTVHACVNSNSKPMRIPTELREIMAGNLKI
jgi:acyl-CoA thioester hydrolase